MTSPAPGSFAAAATAAGSAVVFFEHPGPKPADNPISIKSAQRANLSMCLSKNRSLLIKWPVQNVVRGRYLPFNQVIAFGPLHEFAVAVEHADEGATFQIPLGVKRESPPLCG